MLADNGSISNWEGLQRRTLAVLMVSSIFGRASMSLSFVFAALLMEDILDSSTWAGAATAALTVGTAVSSKLLSSYMGRKGRRPGLTLGYLAGAAGAALAGWGGEGLTLFLFVIGLMFVGVGQGGNNLARYAAADLADDTNRAKAISYVVFASTVGAVGGPALAGFADRLGRDLGLNELIGAYGFAAIAFVVAGLVMFFGLRPDPLVVSGGLTKTAASAADAGSTISRFADGIRMLFAIPLARLAVIGLAISQMVMVMVMAMTPLHMRAHDHEVGTIGWVLAAHTAGMFAFAPLAGWTSDRIGRVPTIAIGSVVLILAAVMAALAGEAPAILMFPSLYLLGLGWSFGMVASSTLLTEAVADQDQVAAQGTADLMASIISGLAALGSGLVFTMAGFHILSSIGIFAAGLMLVATVVDGREQLAAVGA